MSPEDAEEFTQSLGQIIGGSWRQIALAQRLGVPETLGLSTEDWVMQRLGGYIKLPRVERREAVLELKADGLNNVEIGEVLGVGEATVRRDSSPNDESQAKKPHNNGTGSPNDEPRQPRSSELTDADRKREAEWASTVLLHDTLAYLNPHGISPEEWARQTLNSINLEAWPSRKLAEPSVDCLRKCEAAFSALVCQWEGINVKDRKDQSGGSTDTSN